MDADLRQIIFAIPAMLWVIILIMVVPTHLDVLFNQDVQGQKYEFADSHYWVVLIMSIIAIVGSLDFIKHIMFTLRHNKQKNYKKITITITTLFFLLIVLHLMVMIPASNSDKGIIFQIIGVILILHNITHVLIKFLKYGDLYINAQIKKLENERNVEFNIYKTMIIIYSTGFIVWGLMLQLSIFNI